MSENNKLSQINVLLPFLLCCFDNKKYINPRNFCVTQNVLKIVTEGHKSGSLCDDKWCDFLGYILIQCWILFCVAVFWGYTDFVLVSHFFILFLFFSLCSGF